MKNYLLIIFFLSCSGQSIACAQNDPNLGHFYMSRRQITIEDNSPIIINKTGNAMAPNPYQGSLPNSGMSLPKASWQQYSPSVTNFKPNLPTVYKGIPTPAPQATPSPNLPVANTAKANSLKNKAKTAKDNNTVKAYSTYKGYGGKVTNTSSSSVTTAQTKMQSGQMQSNKQINSSVNGQLLHWRPQAKNY